MEDIVRNRIDTIDTISSVEPAAASGFGGAVRRAVAASVGLLLTWQQRAHERHTLAAMDEHMMRDLGLSRVDILVELDKPFWRP
jgi:uncharacterized protein YjiS (DUF1127 family)